MSESGKPKKRRTPTPVSGPGNPLDGIMPEDPLQAMAWLGGLRYAIGEPGMLAAFREDTGNAWTPGATPIEQMIDDASGAPAGFIREFARWYHANVWGE